MAPQGEGPKPIVEQIGDEKARKILDDMDFTRSRNLGRVFHVVRDPANPSIIVSMTVLETASL